MTQEDPKPPSENQRPWPLATLGRPVAGVATLELDARRGEVRRVQLGPGREVTGIDFGAAEEWRLLVTVEGRPCRHLAIPDPGAVRGEGLVEAAVLDGCTEARRRELLARALRSRMGAREPDLPAPSVSVIVCTRGRPGSLRALLSALRRLEPARPEVVVVDNAPREGEDCRELAEEADVYVREDVPGLNNARRAGIAAASGELLAFTDDDCLPPRHWLAVLPELFDDRNVAAATGPAFPATLDTRSQVRFEEAASFSRGLARRDWDFMSLSPALAGIAGAGANLVLRREALGALGEIFPPELDAGTPTRSGGDTYALFKVLAAGRRVAYEPRMFTYHLHRADPRELHGAIRGYGVGLGAVAAKLLVEEREPSALLVYRWLLRQYLEAVAKGLLGAGDPVEVRLGWDYLRGGIAGPRAWRASLGRYRGGSGLPAAPPTHRPIADETDIEPRPPEAPVVPGSEPPELSVVVITNRPGEVPARCLSALAAQAGAPPFEVVLVDDSPAGGANRLRVPAGLRLRTVETGGRGAAQARNAGAREAEGGLLLFLDDDLVPTAELLAAHSARHRAAGSDTVVVGYSPPRPTRPTLAAFAASLWWEDYFRAKRDAIAPTFTEMLSGNVSMKRETFERVGPYDPAFGRFRREDWEWGVRALQMGVGLAYEEGAVAHHRFSLDTRGRLEAARAEGRGDAMLAERYPFVLASIPAGQPGNGDGALSRLAYRLLLDARVRERAVVLLDALERIGAPRAWARWCRLAQRAAYEAGFREAGGRSTARVGGPRVARVELDSDERIDPPAVAAPLLELTVAGRPAATLATQDGQWSPALADRAALRVPGRELRRVASLGSEGARHGGDPRRAAVVFGPACGERERSAGPALAEVGAEIQLAEGDPLAHWAAVDRAVRACERELVALPLPGAVVSPEWLRGAVAGLEGERVALVVGAGVEPGQDAALVLHTRRTLSDAYPAVGLPSQYVAVRRDAYAALGGFDPAAAALGHQGPVLDLIERALERGWVVGHRNTPGLEPRGRAPRVRHRAEWERWRARGALVARDSADRGLLWHLRSGFAPIAVRLLRGRGGRGRGLPGALARAAAFAAGSLHARVRRAPGRAPRTAPADRRGPVAGG